MFEIKMILSMLGKQTNLRYYRNIREERRMTEFMGCVYAACANFAFEARP